jgi:hypothetical protein
MIMWLMLAQLGEVADVQIMPADPAPATYASWAGVAAVPLVAGIVQIAVGTGLPVRAAGLLALVIGVTGSVATALTTDLSILTGFTQGATVGLAAHGLWLTMSSRVDTNGS